MQIDDIDLQILNIVFLFLFLFGIYQFILNSTKHHIAFLFVTCIGCTMIIQFTLIYGGYPDVLCYLFLFLFGFVVFFLPLSSWVTVGYREPLPWTYSLACCIQHLLQFSPYMFFCVLPFISMFRDFFLVVVVFTVGNRCLP